MSYKCVFKIEYALLPPKPRRSLVPLVGFAAVVEEFESWTLLLLLDALQRSGFFTADSKPISLAELQSRVPTSYMRFMAEATDLLKASGTKRLLRDSDTLEMRHLMLA